MEEGEKIIGSPLVVERAPEVANFLAGKPGWVVNYANWIVGGIAAIVLMLTASVKWPVTLDAPFSIVETAAVTKLTSTLPIYPNGILVRTGDRVEAGQLIAIGPNPKNAYDRLLYLEDILSTVEYSRDDPAELARINIPATLSVGWIDSTIGDFLAAQSAYRNEKDAASIDAAKSDLVSNYASLVELIRRWKIEEAIMAPVAGTVTLVPLRGAEGYPPGAVVASISEVQEDELWLALTLIDNEEKFLSGGQLVRLAYDGRPAAKFGATEATIIEIDNSGGKDVRVHLRLVRPTIIQQFDRSKGVALSGTAHITVGRSSLLRKFFR